MQDDRVSHGSTPFQKTTRSDVTKQNLDFEFAKRDDITVIQGLLRMRIKTASIQISAVGGAKVHHHHAVRVTFDDGVQARNTRCISLIRRQVYIGHDRLAFTEPSQREFISGCKRYDLSAVHKVQGEPAIGRNSRSLRTGSFSFSVTMCLFAD